MVLKISKDMFEPRTKTKDSDTVFTKAEQNYICDLAEKEALMKSDARPLGIVLLFNLGLRIGELCGLKWKDLETSNGIHYIHVQREVVSDVSNSGKARGYKILEHCKTEAGDRRLLLNNKAINLFKAIRSINELNYIPTEDDDLIFLRRRKGILMMCTVRCFDPRLRRYCREAGMKVIKSPHDIRRTVLSTLYFAGMPLKKIQEFAGHSTLQQTMDYIRISKDETDMLKYLNTL